MFRSHPIRRLFGVLPPTLALLTMVAPLPEAAAQSGLNCTASDRTSFPCPRATRMGNLPGHTTPAPAPAAPEPRPAPAPRSGEPTYQNELAAGCNALRDAIRTGAAHGLGPEHIALLRRELQRSCESGGVDAQDPSSETRNPGNERRAADKTAAQQAAAERQEQADRCALMRKNLATRRQRPNPTSGDLADLQRFEATYRERCPG